MNNDTIDVFEYETMSKDEEIYVFRKFANGDPSAKEEIILRNMRLVRHVAGRYAQITTSLTLDDLVSEGVFGLVKAIEKFDTERNVKFSTYAVPWIKQSIKRAIENQEGVVRVPAYIQTEIRKKRTETQSLDELIDFKEITENSKNAILVENVISLDAPIPRWYSYGTYKWSIYERRISTSRICDITSKSH